MSDGVQVVKFPTSKRRKFVAEFELGRVVGTPAALLAIEEAGQEPSFFLDKHASGDWGSADAADAKANDESIGSGGRILSVHGTLLGVEAAGIRRVSHGIGMVPRAPLSTRSDRSELLRDDRALPR